MCLSFSKSCHESFFLFLYPFLSAFEFLLRPLSSFFSRSFWPYYKNENFRSASRTNGEWRSTGFKAPTEQVSKDAKTRDASDVHVVITRPSVTRWKVAEEKSGRKADAKIRVTSVAGLCLITVFYSVHYLILYVENSCGIRLLSGHVIKMHALNGRRVWRLKSDLEFLFNSKSR